MDAISPRTSRRCAARSIRQKIHENLVDPVFRRIIWHHSCFSGIGRLQHQKINIIALIPARGEQFKTLKALLYGEV